MEFFYGQQGRPFAMRYNGKLLHYLLNLQGDVLKLIAEDGTSYGTYNYDAWGRLLYATDNKYTQDNPLRYRSYVYDEDTGLYYVCSRYYDPAIGRFISSDVLVSTGQGILGNNMFAYCRNNPVCRVDIYGYADEDAFDGEVDVGPNEDELGGGGSSGSPPVGTATGGSTTGGTSGSSGGGNAPTGGNTMVGGTKPGEPTDVHHIVERCQAKKSGFSQTDINGNSNLVRIPRGVHHKISGYYSSKQPFTENLRVRDWLVGRPFEYQYQFGQDAIEKAFGDYYG